MSWRRAKQISRLSWPIAEQLAWPIVQLTLTPFLLHRIGAAQFGLWVLALTPLIASSSLSLGRSTSLMAVVPRWSAGPRLSAVRPIVLRVLGLTVTMSLLTMAGVMSARRWLLPRLPLDLDASYTYLALVVLLMAATEADNTLSGALKGLQRFRAVALTEVIGRTVQLLVSFAVITTASRADSVIAIAIAIATFKFIVKAVVLHRRLPRGIAEAPLLRDEARRDLHMAGLWMWVQVMCGLVFYSLDRWIVGYFLGAATLAAYSICTQLAQLSHALSAAASQPLIPWAATRIDALSDPATARIVRGVTLGASVGACLAPALVAVFAERLLGAWISHDFAARNAVMATQLALVFLVLAANVPSFNLLIAWGETRFASMLTVAAASFFLIACIALRPEHVGTVIALKLGYAVIGLLAIHRMFGFMRRSGGL